MECETIDLSKDRNFKLPLNYPLDKEEKELISYNAEKLVFLEYVSQLFKENIFDEDILEQIIDVIIKENNREKYVSQLPSLTFSVKKDIVLSHKNIERLRKIWLERIKRINTKYIVMIAGFDLEEVGHYNAYVWNLEKKEVYIFDSLEPYGEHYRKYSCQILNKVSPGFKKFYIESSEEKSLQYTGGNSANFPYYLLSQVGLSRDTIRRISLQSTESQNHFCYLWCIWFLHICISGGDIEDYKEKISNKKIYPDSELNHINDPLEVIKSYGYSLLRYMEQINRVKVNSLVAMYFNLFWDRVDRGLTGDDNPPFSVFEIVIPEKIRDINSCLLLSVSHIIF